MITSSSVSGISAQTKGKFVDFKNLCYRGVVYLDETTKLVKSMPCDLTGKYRGQDYQITASSTQETKTQGLKYRGISY
jgi:hypothetical protein